LESMEEPDVAAVYADEKLGSQLLPEDKKAL
jgi:hypothetical protein